MNIDVNGISITLSDEQLKYIDSELKKKNNQISAENFFLSMWNGCTIKFDFSKTDSIFMLKNNQVLFEQNFKFEKLWCNYYDVWSVLESKYSMNYEQIQAFIKDILERCFKLRALTPHALYCEDPYNWKDVSNWGH